jgi:hypothetical protein
MRQDVIMEGWRRFLKEEKARGTRLDDSEVCLRVSISPGSDAEFTMYTPGKGTAAQMISDLQIIGEVTLSSLKSDGPCLKGDGMNPSWHIEAIHTDEKFRNVGYGGLLYGFAFYVADQNNAGLTSDKNVGSKEDAVDKWKSFEKNSQTFDKVETPAGNDTFDYDEDTPDPDDDCDVLVSDSDNATDYSLDHKNPQIYEQSIATYEANHMDFLDEVLNSGFMNDREFNKFLDQAAFASFKRNYDESV